MAAGGPGLEAAAETAEAAEAAAAEEDVVEAGTGAGAAAGEAVVAVSGESATATTSKAPATKTAVSSARKKDVVAVRRQSPYQPRAPTRLLPLRQSLVISAAAAHCDDGSLCMQTRQLRQEETLHCCKQQLL